MTEAFVTHWQSPLGWLRIEATERGIRALKFIEKPGREQGSSPLLDRCRRELQEYFAGKRRSFDMPVDCEGTAFQRNVWEAARKVPFGETRTYGELSRMVKSPGAARAVGTALSRNPVCLLTPCHRVVPAAGGLGGFAWGTDRKRRLLALEQVRGFVEIRGASFR